MNQNIVLASASPRRKELLNLIFEDYTVCASDIEEIVPESLSAEESPEYLARLKGEDIAAKYIDSLVIGADTAVLADGRILGKPKTEKEAYEMLSFLSGKTHNVITGCAVIYKGVCHSFSVITEVEFYRLSNEEINQYIKTGEPYDKAGGYGIQSKGALFVKKINGDYYNVVGLPVAELKIQLTAIAPELFNN